MVDILAIGSHPDDIEFGCGGILCRAAKEGKSIVMVDLTLGDKGTHGTPEIRKKEAEDSARLIGAERIFLDFKDCEILDSYEGRLELVKVIRKYKPQLLLAPYWKGEQTHPDHIATGLMARYACRYSRFRKILPDLPIHEPKGILHYLYPYIDHAEFIMDISPYVEQWKEMLNCHASQMLTFNFVDWNLRLASKLGMMIGKDYAQGLSAGNPIVIDNLMDIAQSAREI